MNEKKHLHKWNEKTHLMTGKSFKNCHFCTEKCIYLVYFNTLLRNSRNVNVLKEPWPFTVL